MARSVHLVLGGHGSVAVIVDGKQVGVVPVRGSRLYTLARLPTSRSRLLELHFTPGVEAYAFTFGDDLLRMGDGPMFFQARAAAVAAAAERRLTVHPDGRVTS